MDKLERGKRIFSRTKQNGTEGRKEGFDYDYDDDGYDDDDTVQTEIWISLHQVTKTDTDNPIA